MTKFHIPISTKKKNLQQTQQDYKKQQEGSKHIMKMGM